MIGITIYFCLLYCYDFSAFGSLKCNHILNMYEGCRFIDDLYKQMKMLQGVVAKLQIAERSSVLLTTNSLVLFFDAKPTSHIDRECSKM